MKTFPQKLQEGDEVRIIAPAHSLSMIGDGLKKIANRRFKEMGLVLSFSKHAEESDDFISSSVESRISDLHEAFSDKKVKAIITVIGGFNSNQLLKSIDWDLIKKNPKIFCGFSDITILSNSIFAKTGLVTYSGPHYSTFGQKLHLDYTIEYFKKCLMSTKPFEIKPSEKWSDDEWYIDQDKRSLINNDGYLVINEGNAKGTIIGGNLCTLNLLQGTEYMPDLHGGMLFIEDDYESTPHTFDRDLQSLIHQPGFNGIGGIIIGRFQKKSEMSNKLLTKIIKSKKELDNLPVVANIDFGHTDPKTTFPIGGTAKISLTKNTAKIELLEH